MLLSTPPPPIASHPYFPTSFFVVFSPLSPASSLTQTHNHFFFTCNFLSAIPFTASLIFSLSFFYSLFFNHFGFFSFLFSVCSPRSDFTELINLFSQSATITGHLVTAGCHSFLSGLHVQYGSSAHGRSHVGVTKSTAVSPSCLLGRGNDSFLSL